MEIFIIVFVILSAIMYILASTDTKIVEKDLRVFKRYTIPVKDQLQFVSDFVREAKAWDSNLTVLTQMAEKELKKYAGEYEIKKVDSKVVTIDLRIPLKGLKKLRKIV